MVERPEVVDRVILSGTSARMSALAALVRWQTSIPASVSPLAEEDMKRVDPDSLTRIILATYGGIIPDRHAFARAAPGG